MRIRFQNNPRIWRKYTFVQAFAIGLVGYLLYRNGFLRAEALVGLIFTLLVVVVLACWIPAWSHGPYRAGRVVGAWIGAVVGGLLLGLVYLLVLTPIALILRLKGADLLRLRHFGRGGSNWQEVTRESSLDRMF